MAAISGFAFIVIGIIIMINSSADLSSYRHSIGTLFLTLGAVFLGVMASISLSGQTTEEITKNVISVLKHEGLIPPDSELKINEKGQVVKSISNTLTSRFDIEKPYWKAPV
jgi:hypothetical protein